MTMQGRKGGLKVAVVGATGAVGETMLSVLAERKFPVGELVALASERSAGGEVAFGGDEVMVRDLDHFSRFLLDRLLGQAGVEDVNSSFVLRRVKPMHGLPLPQG